LKGNALVDKDDPDMDMKLWPLVKALMRGTVMALIATLWLPAHAGGDQRQKGTGETPADISTNCFSGDWVWTLGGTPGDAEHLLYLSLSLAGSKISGTASGATTSGAMLLMEDGSPISGRVLSASEAILSFGSARDPQAKIVARFSCRGGQLVLHRIDKKDGGHSYPLTQGMVLSKVQ
jgi:hypothetical protein